MTSAEARECRPGDTVVCIHPGNDVPERSYAYDHPELTMGTTYTIDQIATNLRGENRIKLRGIPQRDFFAQRFDLVDERTPNY